MNEPNDLDNFLVELVTDREASELLIDGFDLGIDVVTGSELLGELPFVGSILKLYRFGLGVKNYIFLRKLVRFLHKLSDLTQEEREQFAARLSQDEKLRQKTGETLVLILDRLDDLDKADLLARAFKAYVRSEIDFGNFRRFSVAIATCLVDDLKQLKGYRPATTEPSAAQMLSAVGLLEIDTIPTIRAADSRNRYRTTEFGQIFLEVVLDSDDS